MSRQEVIEYLQKIDLTYDTKSTKTAIETLIESLKAEEEIGVEVDV